jgi:hypothetical protein
MKKYSILHPLYLSFYSRDLYQDVRKNWNGGHKASIRIDDFAVLDGYLPPRALGLVMEWAEMHKDELIVDWKLAKENRPPAQIEPLK